MDRMQPDEFTPKGLPRAFRGYERSSVDVLLSRAASEFAALQDELTRSKDQISQLEAMLAVYKGQENTLHEALMTAQRAADETRSNALKQADAILEDARKRALQIESELQARLNDLRWEFEKLAIDKQRFAERFRSLLEEYLASLVVESTHFRERSGTNGGSQKIPFQAASRAEVFSAPDEEPSATIAVAENQHAVIQDPIEIPEPYRADG